MTTCLALPSPSAKNNQCLKSVSGTVVWTLSIFFLSLSASLAHGQNDDELPFLDLETPLRMNFSGSWEKDFRRSDSWQDELNRMMRLRQERANTQRSGAGVGGGPAVSLGNINLNSGRRGSSVVDLARLAEYISRQNLLTIVQDRNQVRIEREGEAPLVCGVEDGSQEVFTSVHGSEVCGWEEQHLLFVITLPDDLTITHRFTVSSDRKLLQMVTGISSRGSAPFNLRQAFNRFDAPPDNFNCVQTLSRGNVCSQRSQLE
ncbi:MAG: hypothetical protein AB8B95_02960 [Pseudohongiellaceae bacterium]